MKKILIAVILILLMSAPYCRAYGAEVKSDWFNSKDKEGYYIFYDLEKMLEEYKQQKEKEEFEKNKQIAWTTAKVNIREKPSLDSNILGNYQFNVRLECQLYDSEWVMVQLGDKFGYVSKDYLADEKCDYIDYDAPYNSGFKSYMPYTAITSVNSRQYKLQRDFAYTGNFGIRQINERYCVALGTYYTKKIGQEFDLILENGVVIPCILSDQKDDKDTDSSNRITTDNGCIAEFVVDTTSLHRTAKKMGNISYCCNEWNSPVKTIRVYDRNIFKTY